MSSLDGIGSLCVLGHTAKLYCAFTVCVPWQNEPSSADQEVSCSIHARGTSLPVYKPVTKGEEWVELSVRGRVLDWSQASNGRGVGKLLAYLQRVFLCKIRFQ